MVYHGRMINYLVAIGEKKTKVGTYIIFQCILCNAKGKGNRMVKHLIDKHDIHDRIAGEMLNDSFLVWEKL